MRYIECFSCFGTGYKVMAITSFPTGNKIPGLPWPTRVTVRILIPVVHLGRSWKKPDLV